MEMEAAVRRLISTLQEKNGNKVDIQDVHVLKDTLVANTCREQVII